MENERYFHEAAHRLIRTMLSTRMSQVNKRARELSIGEKGLLNCLSLRERGVTAGELKTMTGIGASGVTNLLNSLERKGLIRREMSLTDRRSVIVHISEAGLSLVKSKQEEASAFLQELLARLGKEDTEELIRLLDRTTRIGEKLFEEIQAGKAGRTE